MLDCYHIFIRNDVFMSEKILIIDDDLDTLRLVGLMLQRQGYQISAATNGQQGLEKAFDEDPDLILLDVMMPDMDGYEVTRRLRQNPATLETPILMFTAKTQLDDKVIGFEVGANDYLTKPTHTSEVIVAEMLPGQGALALDVGVANSRGLVDVLSINKLSDITRDSIREMLV